MPIISPFLSLADNNDRRSRNAFHSADGLLLLLFSWPSSFGSPYFFFARRALRAFDFWILAARLALLLRSPLMYVSNFSLSNLRAIPLFCSRERVCWHYSTLLTSCIPYKSFNGYLYLNKNTRGDMLQLDTADSLVDRLPTRSRSLDELLHEIRILKYNLLSFLLDWLCGHPSLKRLGYERACTCKQ